MNYIFRNTLGKRADGGHVTLFLTPLSLCRKRKNKNKYIYVLKKKIINPLSGTPLNYTCSHAARYPSHALKESQEQSQQQQQQQN